MADLSISALRKTLARLQAQFPELEINYKLQVVLDLGGGWYTPVSATWLASSGDIVLDVESPEQLEAAIRRLTRS